MTISIIAAVAGNGVIGQKNDLPWRIPEDMAYFKKMTLGKSVIMGKNTFESIGKPLPERKNIVLSRDTSYKNCFMAESIEEALALVEGEEAMVIGGASIYSQFMPMANKLYLTMIDQEFEGDSFFPEIDFNEWREESRIKGRGDGGLRYDFVVFKKNNIKKI